MQAVPLRNHFLSQRRALEAKAIKIRSELNTSDATELYKSPHDEHGFCTKLMAAGL